MPDFLSPLSTHVAQVRAVHFRNYSQLLIPSDRSPVVLVGENGAGKTNVLEALSLFASGRGLRASRLPDLAASDSTGNHWSVTLTLEGDISLQTGVERTLQGTDRRFNKIQGEPVKSAAAFSEWVHLIWLTPETDRLFLESPSVRRKFIDRLVCADDPLHSDRLHAYEHLLRERLTLLKRGEQGSWLTTIEEQLSSYAAAITIARHQLMPQIMQGSQYLRSIFPAFRCKMEGLSEAWVDESTALTLEEKLKEAYKNSRVNDKEQGMTTYGPHRADWGVIHQAKNQPAPLCSTGEQKILLLGVILSFIHQAVRRHSQLIVLLLDDVIAHLDFYHRMVLFDEVYALQFPTQGQAVVNTWISGTDIELFEPLENRAQYFLVDHGTVTPR